MPINRRTFLGASLGALAASYAAPAIAQKAPLKIGCITSLSGAAGILGKPQQMGMELFARHVNAAGGILGRRVEIVVRDDQSKPNVAVAAVRELAGDGINIFAGALASPVALAISGIAGELDSVFINAASHGNNLTHEDFRANYFRITDYAAMRISVVSRLMAERYPEVTRWGVILPDTEIGRSTIATFRARLPQFHRELNNQAVTIVDPVVVKFGATDFRNAVFALMNSGVDGILIGIAGGDEVGFLQQAGQLGLFDRVKVFVSSGSDFQVAKALGKRIPKDYWNGHHWYFGAYEDVPVSVEVYKQYVAATGERFPDGFIGMGYTAIAAVAAAAARSSDFSTPALVKGLEGLTLDSVKGKLTIRAEDHQALCDVNFVQLTPDKSEMGWKVTDYYKADGADFAGPPTPGVAIRFD